MATTSITKGRTFVSGETVTPAKLNDLVDNATVSISAIQTADISDSQVTTAKIADASSTTTGVTNSKLRHSAALSVVGRSANTDGAPADIAAATDGHVLRRSGTAVGFGTVATAGITDAAVTAAKLDGAQTGSAPIYGCRAWVNFDGTSVNGSNECTLLGSGNVTKVVRNGTGDYTITFATALQDVNYCATGSASSAFGVNEGTDVSVIMDNKAQGGNAAEARTTTTLRLTTRYQVTPYNPKSVNVVIFR